MRKSIKKAHEALDRIEEVLDAVRGEQEQAPELFWDLVLDHNWALYVVDKRNAIATSRAPMRSQ